MGLLGTANAWASGHKCTCLHGIARTLQGGDNMSEAIAFFCGMIAMMIVWFVTDTLPRTSPYRRGYRDGYKDAMEEYKKIQEEE